MTIFRHLKEFISKNKTKYLWGIFILIFVDGLQLITPKLLGTITDAISNHTLTMNGIYKYIVIIIALASVIAFCRYLWRILIMGASRDLEFWLRNKFFNHLEKLSMTFYTNYKTGDLMAHATNDITAVRAAFGPGVVMITDAIFLTISTIIIMLFTIDLRLTATALIPLPFMALTVALFGKAINKRFKSVQGAFSTLTDKTQESISGIRVVKSFVQENQEIYNFSKANQNNVDENMKLIKIWGAMHPMVEFMASLSFMIALLYGGNLVIDKQISLGQFVTFISYLGLLTWPMIAMGWVVNMLQRGSASMDRLNEILDTEPEIIDPPDVLDVDDFQAKVEFKDLTFTYPGSSVPAISNIDIILEKGKTLAIVGRTGSGKTTLANLLLRLYNIENNRLLIGGHDINRLPLALLRKNIGCIPQDNFLFSSSIRDNIAFSNSNMDYDTIENAAKRAEIYDDIMGFPDKFSTVLGERGITLSGGQKQRVSIARALAKDPKILILDDSLSAVDTKTEEKILQSLKQLMKDRTTIVIAHRISTIKSADEIIVLDEGKIIERGTHDALVSLKGAYNRMYEKQLLEDKIQRAE